MSILQTTMTTTAKLLITERPCRQTRAEDGQSEGHCTLYTHGKSRGIGGKYVPPMPRDLPCVADT
jgi:hypothetical protein